MLFDALGRLFMPEEDGVTKVRVIKTFSFGDLTESGGPRPPKSRSEFKCRVEPPLPGILVTQRRDLHDKDRGKLKATLTELRLARSETDISFGIFGFEDDG